jgi:hypothetical protein
MVIAQDQSGTSTDTHETLTARKEMDKFETLMKNILTYVLF